MMWKFSEGRDEGFEWTNLGDSTGRMRWTDLKLFAHGWWIHLTLLVSKIVHFYIMIWDGRTAIDFINWLTLLCNITKSIVLAGAEWLDMIHVANPNYFGGKYLLSWIHAQHLDSCFAYCDKSTPELSFVFFGKWVYGSRTINTTFTNWVSH